MPALHLILQEPAWPDLDPSSIIHVTAPMAVTGLPHGMESGATSVAFRIDLPDGRVVIAETSLALLAVAVRGLRAKWPSPPGVDIREADPDGLEGIQRIPCARS